MIADHNSLISPFTDSVTAHDRLEAIIEARDTEILALTVLALIDARWKVYMYDLRSARKCAMGYTFGHYAQDNKSHPAADHGLRELDRAHVHNTLSPYLPSAYSVFVGRLEHKAGLVSCSSPVFHTNQLRCRCGCRSRGLLRVAAYILSAKACVASFALFSGAALVATHPTICIKGTLPLHALPNLAAFEIELEGVVC